MVLTTKNKEAKVTHAPKTQKNLDITEMNIKLHNPGLVTFYDILPGMGMGLFLQLWSLYEAQTKQLLSLIHI